MSKFRLSVSYSDDYNVVSFAVLDDADELVIEENFTVSALPTDNSAHVHAYGLNKVLTDRTSDIKDKQAKLVAMAEVFELLKTGEWAKERVVGAPVVSCEVEALAQIMELSVPEAQASLAAYPKEQRAQILQNDKVVSIAEDLREARKRRQPIDLEGFIS